MPIVTTDVPITSARNEALIEALSKAYPAIGTEQRIAAESAMGKPKKMHLFFLRIRLSTTEIVIPAANMMKKSQPFIESV